MSKKLKITSAKLSSIYNSMRTIDAAKYLSISVPTLITLLQRANIPLKGKKYKGQTRFKYEVI